MSKKIASACVTSDTATIELQSRLVSAHAPLLVFDPDERWFPVDLPSTIRNSSLHRVEVSSSMFAGDDEFSSYVTSHPQELAPLAPITSARAIKERGAIAPADLESSDEQCFVTRAGWTGQVDTTVEPPAVRPTPDRVEATLAAYRDQSYGARITIYADVCRLAQVPNHEFIDRVPPRLAKRLDLGDAIVVSYYMFFPMADAPELLVEGDWSGISLLFSRSPAPSDIGRTMPLLACYYAKLGIDAAYFGPSAPGGFRLWDHVPRVANRDTGLPCHPIVCISKGRHNCYYSRRMTTHLPTQSPQSAKVEDIENGALKPGSLVVRGTAGTKFGRAVSQLFETLFNWGVEFDVRGGGRDPRTLPLPAADGLAPGGLTAAPDGAETTPGETSVDHDSRAIDAYPTGSPGTTAGETFLRLHVVHVDPNDLSMRDTWMFRGAWGAARLLNYTTEAILEGSSPQKQEGRWLGLARPVLAAWFAWDLYWDDVYGSGGLRPWAYP